MEGSTPGSGSAISTWFPGLELGGRENAALVSGAINVIPMDRTVTTETDLADRPAPAPALVRAERTFSLSMLVSGIRCVLAYVILPFVTPLLGIAPGVGPGLGIVIGTVAIGANLFSMRRFWVLRHPWRKPIMALHISVISFLLVLVALDVAQLLDGV